MPQILQEISLEVSKPNLFQAIVAKQYDMNTRFLKVTFVNDGEKIQLDTAKTVIINALRIDGAANSFFGVVNDDNTATVPLDYWILELEGTVQCDVSIIDEVNEKKLTSTSFTVKVERSSCKDGPTSAPQNDIYITMLQKVAEVEEIVGDIDSALDEIIKIQNKLIGGDE